MYQRQILFPRDLIEIPPEHLNAGTGFDKTWINMPFGKVEAWYLSAPGKEKTKRPAALFAHGNGELIDFWADELRHFQRMGIHLLMVEYPGYGRSEGEPTEDSIRQTFTAAYDWLTRREEVDPEAIILFGRSLGGGAVCTIANTRDSCAMILLSTFTSVGAMAAKYGAPTFVVRDPFDNLSAVSAYTGPILIVHGSSDSVIPYTHAQKLHAAAPDSRLITYDSDHNDCPPDWPAFWHEMQAFLDGVDKISRTTHLSAQNTTEGKP